MGQGGLAVVDEPLSVRAIARLRRLDTSITLIALPGDTNAATFMIAENGADLNFGSAGKCPALG